MAIWIKFGMYKHKYVNSIFNFVEKKLYIYNVIELRSKLLAEIMGGRNNFTESKSAIWKLLSGKAESDLELETTWL